MTRDQQAVGRRWVVAALAASGLAACASGAGPAGRGPAAPGAAAAGGCGPDLRLVASVTGRGPDLVLLPGLASAPGVYDATVARLSGRYRCHQLQVAGFAGVAAPPAPADGSRLGDIVAAVTAYLACLPRPARLVGHSMGGVVGTLVARDRPQLLDRLMVVDALPFFSLLIDPNATSQSIAPMAAATAAVIRAQPEALFRAGQERTMATLVKDPAWRIRALEWSLASDRNMVAGLTQEVMAIDLRPALPSISVPTTVLYAHDPLMPAPPDRVEGLFRTAWSGLPGVQLVRIDGALHFVMLDQPERFAAALDRFLA